jgi:hypothetical protein
MSDARLRHAVEDWMHDAGLFNVNSFGEVVIDQDDVEQLSAILRGETR